MIKYIKNLYEKENNKILLNYNITEQNARYACRRLKKNLENPINNNLSDTVGLRLQITVQVQRAYPVMNVNQSSLLQKIKILKF